MPLMNLIPHINSLSYILEKKLYIFNFLNKKLLTHDSF